MGYSDHRRFPDFSYISKTSDFSMIDLVSLAYTDYHFAFPSGPLRVLDAHLEHCLTLQRFADMMVSFSNSWLPRLIKAPST